MKPNIQATSALVSNRQGHARFLGGARVEQPSVAEIAGTLAPVFQRHAIQLAILFGSRARDDASCKSDIDLILVQETERSFLDRLDGILLELNSLFEGISVEALIYTPSELKQMTSQPFVSKALREGIVIHEQVGTALHG